MEYANPITDFENPLFELLSGDHFAVEQLEADLVSYGFNIDFSESIDTLVALIMSMVPEETLSIVLTAALGGAVVGGAATYAARKHPKKAMGFLRGVVGVIDDAAAGAVNGVNDAMGREQIESYGQFVRRKGRR